VGKNIKLSITTILLSIFLLTSSNAELNNKVIISVGDEIITNYDLDKEINYLNVITVGQIKEMDDQESKKIAIDSLIKDKIRLEMKKGLLKDKIMNEEDKVLFYKFYLKIKNEFQEIEK